VIISQKYPLSVGLSQHASAIYKHFDRGRLAVALQYTEFQSIFTALHEMQTRSSDENSVCPSVRLSVRLSVCQTSDL